MKWKDLSGEERFRVVEMARKDEVPVKELCKTFGVSRQSLKIAMEKADQAAMEALSPKSPGRKGRSKEEVEISSMRKEKACLEKDLRHWKTKYEIAMTFVDLHKKLLNGEPLGEEDEEESSGKKKRRRRLKKRKTQEISGPSRRAEAVAGKNDG